MQIRCAWPSPRAALVASALVLLLGSPATPRAATLCVPAHYPTIQSALDQAVPGDTVLIAPGEYLESVVIRSDSLWVVGEGGAASTRVRGFMGSTLVIENSVVGGEISGLTLRPSPGIVTTVHVHPGSATHLSSLVIEGGSTGLRSEGASPEVVDCLIQDCTAGVSTDMGGEPSFRQCSISDNVLGVSTCCDALPSFTGNRFERNALYNLQVSSYTGPATISATQNWWGTSVEADLASTILNSSAWVGVIVLYDPWCQNPDCTPTSTLPATWGGLRRLFLVGP